MENVELDEKGRPKRAVKNRVNLALMFSLYDDADTTTSAAAGGVNNNGHDGDVDDDGDVIEQWFRDANQINNADRCVLQYVVGLCVVIATVASLALNVCNKILEAYTVLTQSCIRYQAISWSA